MSTHRAGAGAVLRGLIGLWLAALCVPARPGHAAPVVLRPQYSLEATIAPGKPQIEGTLEVTFTNFSNATLYDAVFFLFPNRFSQIDPFINDFLRQYLYPDLEFDPGRMELFEILDAGVVTTAAPLPHPDLPRGTLVSVPIAALPPNGTRRLTLRFKTDVPRRFGGFGEFDDQLTLVGGWYPYLASLDGSGTWVTDLPPALADFTVALTAPAGLEMLLNGRYAPAGTPMHGSVPAVHYLSLVAAPRLLRSETTVGDTRIIFFRRPPGITQQRIAFGPTQTEILLEALRDIVAQRPAAVPPPPAELVVVEAPLRLELTAQGEGDVILSDRALKLASVLHPFHQLQVAQGVYAELLRPQLAGREPTPDYFWVDEGVSYVLAERYMQRTKPERRTVYDWIEMFNIFAVVDRFEMSPKIPFLGAFFPQAKEADPLHAEVTTFNREAPPGRMVTIKLREQLGPAVFEPMLDACLQSAEPMRTCVAETSGDPTVTVRLDEWTLPYPEIDYSVGATDYNRRENGHFRTTVEVRRRSSRPFAEPVTIRLKSLGGADVDMQWKSSGDVAIVSAPTSGRVYQAVIDPDRKLIDDDRANNAWPPRVQVVLDSTDIEVSSTEFGFSALAVARLRYDYRWDLAAAGFYTNRGTGFTFGGRLHWGEPIDRSRFRNNLYAFYTFAGLDRGFKEDREAGQAPAPTTPGQIAGFGFRYDYTNVFWTDNPTGQRRFRLYADWYDKGLGSDYDYADWGYTASATLPVFSQRTIAAGQIFNGFSSPFGSSVVPNQGLYSLGGSRSIRGIGAEDDLARNIFVIRTELRREILPELDLNLMDFLVLRRTQVKLLVDAGEVSNSAGRIYDVGRWSCGVGGGFSLIYDFMGFFTSAAYFEVATNVQDPGDVQFLFGSNQAF